MLDELTNRLLYILRMDSWVLFKTYSFIRIRLVELNKTINWGSQSHAEQGAFWQSGCEEFALDWNWVRSDLGDSLPSVRTQKSMIMSERMYRLDCCIWKLKSRNSIFQGVYGESLLYEGKEMDLHRPFGMRWSCLQRAKIVVRWAVI